MADNPALPPKATICCAAAKCCYGPIATYSPCLRDFVYQL
jgi:hypothetical protein